MNNNDYVVLINKPINMTSFKVTGAVKRKLGIKKAGHAGTLDPMATGVLPVMTGRATRLIDMISIDRKRYKARFMLGMTTDTLDYEGQVLTEQPVLCDKTDIENAVNGFIGEITQIPPMYSALKKDGVKLYELARKGIEIERKSRKITIDKINVISIDEYEDTFICEIDVICSKGTYIRTLIDDIGVKLGCGAFMTSLERTSSNGFDIESCVSLDEFLNSDNPLSLCKQPDFAIMDFKSVTVSENQSKRFRNGGELFIDRIKPKLDKNALGEKFRVYCADTNEFIGVGIIKDDLLCPICVF